MQLKNYVNAVAMQSVIKNKIKKNHGVHLRGFFLIEASPPFYIKDSEYYCFINSPVIKYSLLLMKLKLHIVILKVLDSYLALEGMFYGFTAKS